MIMKKITISIITASFFLIGCSNSFIKEPIVAKGPQWQIEIKALYSSPDESAQSDVQPDAEKITKNLLDKMTKSGLGSGTYLAGSVEEVYALKRKVADKYYYITGKTVRTNYGLGYVIAPSHKDLSFAWMKIQVKNTGSQVGEFDFDRVRILFPTYVTQPVAITTPKFMGKTTPSVTLKPGEDAIRTLVFVYLKYTKPFKLVYDRIVNNKVSNKIVIKVPEISTN
jgi:hypothetical protein